jgi:chromate reductase
MASARDVAVLVGSLRRESLSRKLANALRGLAPPSLALEIVEIRELALYDEDLEANVPPAWAAFRGRIKRADAVLFVTPEYNRSVPGLLKNALDVGSRPYGHNVFDRKPGAIVSQSPGALSAFGANHHLRQSLVFLNVPTLQQPEAYVGGTGDLFDAGGRITKDATSTFLTQFLGAFADWIERVRLVAG